MIIMKRILVVLFLLPALVFAQIKQKPKSVVKAKTRVKVTNTPPLDGFIINGTITGYPEGTKIALLNGQSGMSESETTIQKNKFSFKGKITVPDFKASVIASGKQSSDVTFNLIKTKIMEPTKNLKRIKEAQIFTEKELNLLEGMYKNAIKLSLVLHTISKKDLSKIKVRITPNDDLFNLEIK